jgi:hypothetical protein
MRYFRTGIGIVVVLWLGVNPGWAWQLDNIGMAGGWDDINKSAVVTAVIDTGDFTLDMPAARVATAVTNAYNTWDAVPGAINLNFSFKADQGGNYDVFDGPGDSNGPPWFNGSSGTLDKNAHWRYANIAMGGWLPESYFGDPRILAVTWTGRLSGDGSAKPAWHAEVFLNDAWNWTDDGAAADADLAAGLPNRLIDLETVALHELGHTVGLAHEDADSSVMATYYDGTQRTLFEDDIKGLSALYSDRLKGGGKGPKPGRSAFDDGEWCLTGITYVGDSSFGAAPVPEPGTLSLLAVGGLAVLRRRCRRGSARRPGRWRCSAGEDERVNSATEVPEGMIRATNSLPAGR